MLLVGFVDVELAIGIEEEESIFVAFLHNPATAILCVNFHLAIFAADLLFGKELIALVVDLDVGMAIGVVDQCIHIVAIDCVGDKVHLVGIVNISSYDNNICHMIIVPVAIAVEPEARPVVVMVAARIPVDWVAVHHAVMMRMIEVGSRMHWMMRGRHRSVGMTGASISTFGGRSHAARTSVTQTAAARAFGHT